MAPSGSVGTLDFPALGNCPPTGTCLYSVNDIRGLRANAISIDDGNAYNVGYPSSNAITLGAGGLTAAPSPKDRAPGSGLEVPIVLGADQTWSIDGGGINHYLNVASVAGSHALTVVLRGGGSLGLAGEIGPVTVTGSGSSPGNLEPSSLNTTDGNPIDVTGGAGLLADPAETGPLTVSGGQIQIGVPYFGSPVLTVDGPVSFDSNSTLTMFVSRGNPIYPTDYSSLLRSTGNINLGGATLNLLGISYACTTPGGLIVGDVLPLVATTAAVSGTFSNAPNGATLTVKCGTTPAGTVRIDYTSTGVTATVVSTQTEATPANPAAYNGDSNFAPSSVSDQLAPAPTLLPSPAQIDAALDQVLAPHGKRARIAQLLRAGGFTVTFHDPGTGILQIAWIAAAGITPPTRARNRQVLVATVTATFARSDTYKVKIKLTQAGKHLLDRPHKLRLTADAVFTPTGGNARTEHKAFTLRR